MWTNRLLPVAAALGILRMASEQAVAADAARPRRRFRRSPPPKTSCFRSINTLNRSRASSPTSKAIRTTRRSSPGSEHAGGHRPGTRAARSGEQVQGPGGGDVESRSGRGRHEGLCHGEAGRGRAQRAATGSGTPGGELKWEKAASLPDLMKQVPMIHTKLKLFVKGKYFKKKARDTAGRSAAIAAIAQGSIADTSATKAAGQVKQWQTLMAAMRDDAGAVNAAIHAGDQPATTAAMKKLNNAAPTVTTSSSPTRLSRTTSDGLETVRLSASLECGDLSPLSLGEEVALAGRQAQEKRR